MSSSSNLILSTPLSARSSLALATDYRVPQWVIAKSDQQYFQVAIVTILTYDAIITMDKEAMYFWKIPRRPADFVYFANRYIGILGAFGCLVWNTFNTDVPLCNDWTKNLVDCITVILIDYILLVRVLALYSQDRALSICLHILLALEAIFRLGLSIYLVLLEHNIIGSHENGVQACGDGSIFPWKLGIIDWVIPLAYGVILMTLALYKATWYWRRSAGLRGSHLIKVLIFDQVLYFALILICCLFNILEFKFRTSNQAAANALNILGNPSFLCVLGSRMLINLKEVGERGQNEGTSYKSSMLMSEVGFADPEILQRRKMACFKREEEELTTLQ